MRVFAVFLIFTIYTASGFAQGVCSTLFAVNLPTQNGTLAKKANTLFERLNEPLKTSKTVFEAIKKRDSVLVPELRQSLLKTDATFKELIQSLRQERKDSTSEYGKMSRDEYNIIIKLLRDHKKDLEQILKRGLTYKDTIFLAYRSSLLFIFLKTEDYRRINTDAFRDISRDQILDFIINSRTYEDALIYSLNVKNEITQNFIMLDTVLKDPLTQFYFTRDLPSIRTLNLSAPKGTIYASYNEKLSNVHKEKDFPPYFLTYHDVVHAHNVSKNKNEFLRLSKNGSPTLSDYIQFKENIEKTLTILLESEKFIPENRKDYFQAVFNALTHDFVPKLYHSSSDYVRAFEGFDNFVKFRNTTIQRAVLIYQEQMSHRVHHNDEIFIGQVFDEMIFRSRGQIEKIQFQ